MNIDKSECSLIENQLRSTSLNLGIGLFLHEMQLLGQPTRKIFEFEEANDLYMSLISEEFRCLKF